MEAGLTLATGAPAGLLDRCSIKVLTELYKTMTETDFRAELSKRSPARARL
jgi:hypothetical protein